MAVLSTHTLNSVDGGHAGGVALALFRIEKNGTRTRIVAAETDEGGRFSADISLEDADLDASYELVLQTGGYFAARNLPPDRTQICRETVIRFEMPDPDARYHVPMILAPNGYSVWWSGLGTTEREP